MEFWNSRTWRELQSMINDHADGEVWAPHKQDLLRPFIKTPLTRTKVVILGSDPYHQPGVADGLAFSTRGVSLPHSLQNIVKELHFDLGFSGKPTTGSLESWASQGVLLLNSSLTTKIGQPHSHAKLGWDELVQETLYSVTEVNPGAVFILLGEEAQKIANDVGIPPFFYTIETAHPSPVSAHKGFFGSRIFSKTNSMLSEGKDREINWCLPGMNFT